MTELNKVQITGRVIFFKEGFYIEDGKPIRTAPLENKLLVGIALGTFNPDKDKPITKVVLEDAMSSIGWISYDNLVPMLGQEKVQEIIKTMEAKIVTDAKAKSMDLVQPDQC